VAECLQQTIQHNEGGNILRKLRILPVPGVVLGAWLTNAIGRRWTGILGFAGYVVLGFIIGGTYSKLSQNITTPGTGKTAKMTCHTAVVRTLWSLTKDYWGRLLTTSVAFFLYDFINFPNSIMSSTIISSLVKDKAPRLPLPLEIGIVEQRRVHHEQSQNYNRDWKESGNGVNGMEGNNKVVVRGNECDQIDDHQNWARECGHQRRKGYKHRSSIFTQDLKIVRMYPR
jgi:hypothetical protein